jgi:hypothetical protein
VTNADGDTLLPYFRIRDYLMDQAHVSIDVQHSAPSLSRPASAVRAATPSLPDAGLSMAQLAGAGSQPTPLWTLLADTPEVDWVPVTFTVDLLAMRPVIPPPQSHRRVALSTPSRVPAVTGNFLSWGPPIPMQPVNHAPPLTTAFAAFASTASSSLPSLLVPSRASTPSTGASIFIYALLQCFARVSTCNCHSFVCKCA